MSCESSGSRLISNFKKNMTTWILCNPDQTISLPSQTVNTLCTKLTKTKKCIHIHNIVLFCHVSVYMDTQI